MAKKSAGILLYRFRNTMLEVLLVHPGGPFWAKKDYQAWSIPKGEFADSEDAFEAAKRELEEETGIKASGKFIALTPIVQKSGKTVYAWALEKDIDHVVVSSNHFSMEWPPGSGIRAEFPEVDKASWFGITEAKNKIVAAQFSLIEELANKIL
ncbi:MAG: NUDIX domain-containing protein [Chitinophagaceae bacterium]|nr:NUDIX domain-containing protein [Chitinophagaceae bacterium]